MKKIIVVLFVFTLALSGCSLSCRSGRNMDGGVFKSIDGGEQWQAKNYLGKNKKGDIFINNVDVSCLVFDPQDKNIVYLGTLSNGIYRSKDGAETWQQTPLNNGNYPSIAIDIKAPAIMYTVNGGNILKSTDAGDNWTTIYTDTQAGQTITQITVDFYDNSKVYAATSGGGILASNDYGNNWRVIKWFDRGIKKFFLRPDNSKYIYVVLDKAGLYRSLDGGSTWENLNESFSKYAGATNIQDLAFDSNPSTIYLASNYGLLKSIDGGLNWQSITTLIPNNTVPIFAAAVNNQNPKELYIAVQNRMHKSTDGGQNWKTINVPTSREIHEILINPVNPSVIYLGTKYIKK